MSAIIQRERAVVTKILLKVELDGNEEAMKEFIANFGPATVVIWVTSSFLSYKSGVYYDDTCPKGPINHAVAIVGYGVDPEFGDFWWIRNSWGESWGYSGYGKVGRNNTNTCNICNYVMVPF